MANAITATGLRAEGTAPQLKRRIPGGHVKLRFDDEAATAAAAGVLADATRAGAATVTVTVTAATVAQGTALSVARDMTEGIVARFRAMSIPRGAILADHVMDAVIQVLGSLVVIVAVGLLMGYRPDAEGFGWLGAAGLAALIGFALAWLTTALGVASKTAEMAGMLPMLGSGFVPTDSMPTVMRWFADYQPFTPMMDALRGLLSAEPDPRASWLTVGWCLGLSLVGYLWARATFEPAFDV